MGMNPRELAEKRVRLSAEYSATAEELGKLKAGRAIQWLLLRKNCKTDKEADNTLAATEDGQRETILTFKCKGLEKEISAISSYLRVLDGEARNLH